MALFVVVSSLQGRAMLDCLSTASPGHDLITLMSWHCGLGPAFSNWLQTLFRLQFVAHAYGPCSAWPASL